MFISVVPNRKSTPTILLRETYREDGKVKNRTLANLTQWAPEKVAALAAALDSARSDGPTGGEEVGTIPHGHVHAVLGTARRLGLDAMLLARPCRERDLAMAMIAGRILDPGSKLALARELGEAGTSTQGERESQFLGALKAQGGRSGNISLREILQFDMDQYNEVKRSLAVRHLILLGNGRGGSVQLATPDAAE
jgi:hypothetical protein